MEKESGYKIALVVLLVIVFLGNFQLQNLKHQLRAYQSALRDANENIEEANSVIEEAQSYAWSNYDEMGDALDNLYTVDTVSDPR